MQRKITLTAYAIAFILIISGLYIKSHNNNNDYELIGGSIYQSEINTSKLLTEFHVEKYDSLLNSDILIIYM